MEHKPNTIKNWKLAVLFSGIFSLFGVITNNTVPSGSHFLLTLPSWLLTFSFLLVAWFLNSSITNLFFFTYPQWRLVFKISVVFLVNGALLCFFILVSQGISDSFNVDREFNLISLAVRGTVSIAIIYLVQFTLNLNTKNQSVQLQNQMLQTENIRARFEILRQQISPHFLFNSLSSLRFMIRSSNKNAENFVIKLSDIYRMLLAKNENDTVSLKEELEFIDDYSFLLFARYENMLRIDINIPPAFLELKIPTFTLQLLLENCVKHNIVSKEKPLYIKIYDSGLKSISIENNLQQRINTEEESGIGLSNLMKRYELLGVSHGVQIFSDESVYRVKIKLLDA